MADMYHILKLRHAYNGRMVLDIPELSFGQGMITGITGHNGSGKSTLLSFLACLARADQGTIMYDGNPLDVKNLAVRREITLLLQTPYLLKSSVQRNIAYGLKLRGGVNRGKRDILVAQAMEMVGLAPERFASRSWFELSGGEAQRVALAARLVLQPRVLLLDEPTASLDQESGVLIREATAKARDRWNTTVIVVSHDRAWLDSLCDGVVRMADGRVVDNRAGHRP